MVVGLLEKNPFIHCCKTHEKERCGTTSTKATAHEITNYLTYPHEMATVSQDNHDPLVQFFYQTRRSGQIGRNVTKGNSRVCRDLLCFTTPSPTTTTALLSSSIVVVVVNVEDRSATCGRSSSSTSPSPPGASTTSCGILVWSTTDHSGWLRRRWHLLLLRRGGWRWHLLLLGTRLHGFVYIRLLVKRVAFRLTNGNKG
jgi:hypothetical protein